MNLMNPNTVLEFLRAHPNFLDENGLMLLEKPKAQDRSLSLTEYQLRVLREKNVELEAQMREMIRAGHENDEISERLHRLALAFLICDSEDTTVAVLKQTLTDEFLVPAVEIRLWGEGVDPNEALPTSELLQNYIDQLDMPYCGRDVTPEILNWFAEPMRSFAFLPLRASQTFGVLALASPDETRFHATMGTFFLTRLSELAGVAISRFLNLP